MSRDEINREMNDLSRPTLFLKIVVPLVVVAVGVAVALWLLDSRPKARSRAKTRNATLVEVQPITFGPMRTSVSAMGTVVPARSVEVRPQVSGTIIEQDGKFIPGGRFAAGETILSIDPTDYVLAVRQAETEVARAEAELQLEKGNQLIAQKEYEFLGEAVSEEEKDLMLRRPQLESLQAALDAARTKLDQARNDLERTHLVAPFDAAIQSRTVTAGGWVSQGSVLATLVGTESYWVEALVPVSQLRWLKIPRKEGDEGSRVRLYNDPVWREGLSREGRILRLATDLDDQGRMARLIVSVDDPLCLKPENADLQPLLINTYVRVEIEGIEIPETAAITRELVRDGDRIWIMDKDDRLDIRRVEVAFRGADHLLVTGGVSAGERLITSPLASPVSGMQLRLGGDDSGRDKANPGARL